ncbi:MAG: electron transport complex subunit RsxG [Gammaproteobacteria bacterium]|jgi:Na+-translocating ferredoxin:NAD+ oxidoreductase subunit G
MNAGKNMLISASLLGLFAIVGTALVAFTNETTTEQVAANQSAYTLSQLHQIISPKALDNDLEHDTIQVTDPLLGSNKPMTVYRARKNGKPVAAIIEAIAPDGYSGQIAMLVGIRTDGSLLGVRVTDHHETPGLGDNIDIRKSNWILQFNNLSLNNPKPANWKVKRDGGAIDQITSATISSRAVTKAVYHALEYFKAHRQLLFSKPTVQSRGNS